MTVRSYHSPNLSYLLRRASSQRGIIFGTLIIAALFAFEIFNYSSTDFAMRDLLGELSFLGIRWATILAIAFCGIDFAGIARLFTPQVGDDEPSEVWYLFGAWLLTATMNAALTWWGVSIAILNHPSLGNAVVDKATLLRVVPVFVAIMVWLIRILIIGTFSIAGERLFLLAQMRASPRRPRSRGGSRQATASGRQRSSPAYSSFRPAAKARPEPSYQQMPMSARPNRRANRTRH